MSKDGKHRREHALVFGQISIFSYSNHVCREVDAMHVWLVIDSPKNTCVNVHEDLKKL